MSFLSDLFGGGDSSAQTQLSNYYNQGRSALNPYAAAGNNILPQLMSSASALMNPEALEQQWASSYTESPEAKAAEAMATQHGLSSASSMGLIGSSPAVTAIQEGTSDIGLQDKQNYLHDLMQKYLAGVNAARGIYSGGERAAGAIGDLSQTMGENSADLAYNASNGPGDLLAGLLGTAGGAFLGGPGGAALGGALAKHF